MRGDTSDSNRGPATIVRYKASMGVPRRAAQAVHHRDQALHGTLPVQAPIVPGDFREIFSINRRGTRIDTIQAFEKSQIQTIKPFVRRKKSLKPKQ